MAVYIQSVSRNSIGSTPCRQNTGEYSIIWTAPPNIGATQRPIRNGGVSLDVLHNERQGFIILYSVYKIQKSDCRIRCGGLPCSAVDACAVDDAPLPSLASRATGVHYGKVRLKSESTPPRLSSGTASGGVSFAWSL